MILHGTDQRLLAPGPDAASNNTLVGRAVPRSSNRGSLSTDESCSIMLTPLGLSPVSTRSWFWFTTRPLGFGLRIKATCLWPHDINSAIFTFSCKSYHKKLCFLAISALVEIINFGQNLILSCYFNYGTNCAGLLNTSCVFNFRGKYLITWQTFGGHVLFRFLNKSLFNNCKCFDFYK